MLADTARSPTPRGLGWWLLGVTAVAAIGGVRVCNSLDGNRPSSPYIERVSSLAGGAQVLAAFEDAAHRRRLLRIPGRPARQGADVVVAPEVLHWHGVVAALPGGAYYLRDAAPLGLTEEPVRPIDRDGWARYQWIDPDQTVWATHNRTALLRPPEPHPVRGLADSLEHATTRGLQCDLRPGGRVSCCDWRHHEDDGLDGIVSPFGEQRCQEVAALSLPDAAQVVVVPGVVCVRGRAGAVRCALDREEGPMTALPLSGSAPAAKAVALSSDDLCLVGADDSLWCVRGLRPGRDLPIAQTPLRLHRVLEGVTAVGLSEGLGCAQRGGRIDCWGPLVDDAWTVWRDRPVSMAALHAVTALTAHEGIVCALAQGKEWCWGVSPSGLRYPEPECAPLTSSADGIVAAPRSPEALLAMFSHDEQAQLDALGARLDLVGDDQIVCALLAAGGVACRAHVYPARSEPGWPRVPGLDDAAQVVVARGLACARRRAGGVVCWGNNRSGALTRAERARSPGVVTLPR